MKMHSYLEVQTNVSQIQRQNLMLFQSQYQCHLKNPEKLGIVALACYPSTCPQAEGAGF
jgi:hypothetical protein